ncbi:MAG: hypothetical protein AABM67_17900 [Acidobacteriota bacterium]
MRYKATRRCGSALAALVLMVGAGALAQAQNQQPPIEPAQTQTQAPPNQIPDLAPLNLTQDQIQRIRIINAELKDQRQAAVLRLRLARRALTEAIESPTPNEALIDQRSRELAEAQAATIRIRSLAESRILLQVLTPEQRVRLREIRQQNQAGRRGGDQQLPRNRALRRQDRVPGNNNTLAPLTAPRRQQRRP